MKKNNLTLSVLIYLIINICSFSEVNAQCNVPAYIPAFAHELSVNNLSDVDLYYSHENGLATKYYGAKCGANPIQLKYNTINPASRTLQMYLELWKQKFDCNGNLIGSKTYVLSTAAVEYAGNASNIAVYLNINVETNTYYQVRPKRRLKTFGIYGSYNNNAWSNNLRFIAPISLPSPAGNFSDLLSIDSRTSNNGYNASVHQLDVDGAFNFDASPTSCESNWRYYIKEFDIANWSSSNAYASPVFNGQAGNIDMDAVYPHGFQRGKVYLLTLVAGQGWYSKNYWFEIKDATLVGKLSGPRSNESGHTVYLPCKGSMKLNTKGTESVDKWRVRVQPVNSSFSLIGTEASTGIVSGQVPLDIDLGSLYGSAFVLYQRYRVVYEITAPGDTRIYYFKYIICDRSSSRGGGNVEESSSIIESEDLEIKIYPNPVMDNLSIQIAGTVNHKSQVNILNQLGQTVFEKSSFSQDGIIEINIQHLPKGIYFLKVVNGDAIITKKFIKN